MLSTIEEAIEYLRYAVMHVSDQAYPYKEIYVEEMVPLGFEEGEYLASVPYRQHYEPTGINKEVRELSDQVQEKIKELTELVKKHEGLRNYLEPPDLYDEDPATF